MTEEIAPRYPTRHRRSRAKGHTTPDDAVYVGRGSIWGNPFRIGGRVTLHTDDDLEPGYTHTIDGMTAEQAVEGYRDLMHTRLTVFEGEENDPETVAHVQEWRDRVESLRGRDLICWCPMDAPCHANVLLRLANSGLPT